MGKLHDRLKEIGYEGHPLEVYLVRVLFCLFAEDTTIFEKHQFENYISNRTSEDGSDLAAKIQELFQVLNTPTEKRFKNLDEQLAGFPYINGKLFDEPLTMASFDTKMRQALLNCCYIDWSKISPAIFGSMFQSVMNPVERRNFGAHYTSETNILKLIKPLFLDKLWQEFEAIKGNRNKLIEFHKKIAALKFLDPACGCGNFLVITYRELRLLEIAVLRAMFKTGQGFLNIQDVLRLDVDQFYGIEYEEFPARIAEVALWLMDHQMNMLVSQEFGEYFIRIPLKKAANIVIGDALEIKWETLTTGDVVTIYANQLNYKEINDPIVKYGTLNVIAQNTNKIDPSQEFPLTKHEARIHYNYIFGNPPFIGSKMMSPGQREAIVKEFGNIQGSGVMDYVTGWYIKAAKYISNLPYNNLESTKVAFVSTNSIVQGEQTSILWEQMLNKYNIKIHFAHRTFKWSNEAKSNAAVYCVIIGFANFDTESKSIFDYEDIKGEAHEIKVKNINPYLVDAKDILIQKRSSPICNVPKMSFGNMPLDGGNLLLSDEEKTAFISKEPKAENYIKPLISAYEFLNGQKRWCLWLKDIEPNVLVSMPEVMKRVSLVREFRLSSVRPSTIKNADTPKLFGEIRDFGESFIVIPRVSSENRKYIPMGFFNKGSIVGDTCMAIPDGTLFHFGVLMSKMHVAWVKYVCGRLKSDFRYSKDNVYNNFPWPENNSGKHSQLIEAAAKKVLDSRLEFPDSSLSNLYNPLSMPQLLVKAHTELDKAVDTAYRSQPFASEAERMEYLFGLYEKYVKHPVHQG